jgi:hypothetical protein
MSNSYNTLMSENQVLLKKLNEKEKYSKYLEGELDRRTKEYKEMTTTFEEFLVGRAKQAKKDRNEKLRVLSEKQKKEKPISMGIIKATVPDRVAKVNDPQSKTSAMVDRGYIYLARFKNLSKAFQTGDFRNVQNMEMRQDLPGPWTKVGMN